MNPSAMLVSRELPVVIGESSLSHNQIAKLHLLGIASTDTCHDADTWLALLQHTGKIQRHILRSIAWRAGDMQGQGLPLDVFDRSEAIAVAIARATVLFNKNAFLTLLHNLKKC